MSHGLSPVELYIYNKPQQKLEISRSPCTLQTHPFVAWPACRRRLSSNERGENTEESDYSNFTHGSLGGIGEGPEIAAGPGHLSKLEGRGTRVTPAGLSVSGTYQWFTLNGENLNEPQSMLDAKG